MLKGVTTSEFDVESLAGPHLGRWCTEWGVPGLARELRVSASSRMRTSLGLCAPKRRELRIARFVVDGPRDLLLEVLCHEAAHAAVYEIHGRRVRPHGREWRGLMKAAGYEPRARLPAGALDGRFGSVVSRVVWEHRCNVCQAQRQAGRPVREWRCVRCRASGREGSLTITRCELGGGE